MSKDNGAAVAVLGMACRLPGAETPEEFWELIRAGGSAVDEVPPSRWDSGAFYDPEPGKRGSMCSRAGGHLAGLERFDAELFGLTPREVERMDPQQRLILEVAWEALEDAALTAGEVAGSRTGVFIGAGNADFGRKLLDEAAEVDVYSLVGGGLSMLANRLSYVLDLRGPSVVVDTACSGSLVAVHQAMRSLHEGECDLAIAGGVNVCLSPEVSIANSHAGLLSPTDGSKVFDAAADGFVRSEGCALVVLRRDEGTGPVHARLLGSAMAGSGRGNGLGAPNATAQEDVVRRALANAGVEPAEVGYVETHATGTPIGDAIETGALSRVFSGTRTSPCRLGSVKAAIGHLEAVSGAAALIKTALVLRHGWIPPVPVAELSPQIRLGDGVEIPTGPRTWEGRRVAGIDSFGYGGNNVHLVVGAASGQSRQGPDGQPQILLLSARSDSSLSALADRYARFLRARTDLPVADIAYTARAARTHHPHRLTVVGTDHEELARNLAHARRSVAGEAPAVAFEFADDKPDDGWFRRLCDDVPALREITQSLTGMLHTPVFLPQYALAMLLAEWGVCPDLVIGYGSGELSAACTAGAMNPYDGVEDTAAVTQAAASVPLQLGNRLVPQDPPHCPVTVRFCSDISTDGRSGLLRLLGDLHCAGVELDWDVFDALEEHALVHLPATPLEHRDRWPLSPKPAAPPRPAHPLLQRRTG